MACCRSWSKGDGPAATAVAQAQVAMQECQGFPGGEGSLVAESSFLTKFAVAQRELSAAEKTCGEKVDDPADNPTNPFSLVVDGSMLTVIEERTATQIGAAETLSEKLKAGGFEIKAIVKDWATRKHELLSMSAETKVELISAIKTANMPHPLGCVKRLSLYTDALSGTKSTMKDKVGQALPTSRKAATRPASSSPCAQQLSSLRRIWPAMWQGS